MLNYERVHSNIFICQSPALNAQPSACMRFMLTISLLFDFLPF